jgi:DNA-binding NarL/FixJ family response regulator
MTRVLIVDFDSASEGLVASVLEEQRPDLQAVTRCVPWDLDVRDRISDFVPDVVLLDLGFNGDGRIDVVRSTAPAARIVARVAGDGATSVALDLEANGLIANDSDVEVVLESIVKVLRGGTFLDPRLSVRLVRLATRGARVDGPFGLTLQQLRVVELLSRGLTNQQIANELGLGVATVKTHVYNAMRKLRVSTRTEAAAFAMRNGLV